MYRIERERDAKLETLELQRKAIMEDFRHNIDGVEAELQKTIAFLQVFLIFDILLLFVSSLCNI